MSKELYTNNAKTTLTAQLLAGGTSCSVADGSIFPAPGTDENYRCTLIDSAGNFEIVLVTARTGNNFTTIARAQEGTIARQFEIGDKVQLRVTRGGVEKFSQLDTQQEYTEQHSFDAKTLTDAANIAWDLDKNQVAQVTLAGNRTLDNPTNMRDGATYVLRIKQDVTGTRTLAFGSAYKFAESLTPSLSSGGDALDILSCTSDGVNMYCNLLNNFG